MKTEDEKCANSIIMKLLEMKTIASCLKTTVMLRHVRPDKVQSPDIKIPDHFNG